MVFTEAFWIHRLSGLHL